MAQSPGVGVIEAGALIRRAAKRLAGHASLDGALEDAATAVRIADLAGDATLKLDALEIRAQVLTGMGRGTAEDWLVVERAARKAEDWARASSALRMQTMTLLDDHAADAAAPATRLAVLAATQGLGHDLAWAESVRAEIAFVTGAWDEALTIAMRAIAVAGRAGDPLTALRGWHVVIPIASERRDVTRLGLAYYPYTLRRRAALDSPYRRVLDVAAFVRFDAAGILPVAPKPPGAHADSAEDHDRDPRDLLPAFAGAAAMPHWLAAMQTVVETWIRRGQFDAVEHALEQMSASRAGGNASALGAGVEALLRARLLEAEGGMPGGVAAQGWHALEQFSAAGAPWWTATTIGLLARLKESSPPLNDEARRIRGALRLADPADSTGLNGPAEPKQKS